VRAPGDANTLSLVEQTIQFGDRGEELVMVLNLDGVAGMLYGDPRMPEAGIAVSAESKSQRLIA
jgi:hypothetical protein